ncbi:MAG TPA: hypothetical protein VES42_25385, partial [Pilimelia sp.]|nr:hypothetical protein [Pilimelia sp.]
GYGGAAPPGRERGGQLALPAGSSDSTAAGWTAAWAAPEREPAAGGRRHRDTEQGYDQGAYDQSPNGQSPNGQSAYDQRGYDRGGYEQGGYDRGGYEPGGYGHQQDRWR